MPLQTPLRRCKSEAKAGHRESGTTEMYTAPRASALGRYMASSQTTAQGASSRVRRPERPGETHVNRLRTCGVGLVPVFQNASRSIVGCKYGMPASESSLMDIILHQGIT